MRSTKHLSLLVLCCFLNLNIILSNEEDSINMGSVWISDNGNGTYTNPVLHSDYSDPDVIKVGDDFYMVSSSFNCVPGVPVLHSKDLINWSITGHVFNNQPPDKTYDKPGHGNGVWAPSIRYHNGEYYVCYADPDYGIYMAKATNPSGPWTHKLIQKAYGWIDPCPFWDDNDSAYLVHAYAKSRAGFNSVLTLRRMSRDGEKISLTDTVLLFNGNDPAHPRVTIEGPKMYKRNGYYYIFAPYGGVAQGSQVVLRSDSIFGTYKDTTVLEQGSTNINGPHQGGWVELESGESWFLHFQEYLPYGRILHLQPLNWINNWPLIGEDFDENGIGEPVSTHNKPNVGHIYPITNPLTSDKFDAVEMGLQWQWHSNFDSSWYSLDENPGNLRLFAVTLPVGYKSLWDIGSMILQKLPAERFSVTTKVNPNLNNNETVGLVAMGQNYSYISIKKNENRLIISQKHCINARNGTIESEVSGSSRTLDNGPVYLRVNISKGGKCNFSYSTDGNSFNSIGNSFIVDEGRWIGAKVGLLCNRPYGSTGAPGYADFEWFNVDYFYNKLPYSVYNPLPADGDSLALNSDLMLSWDGDNVLTDSFYVYMDEQTDPFTRVSAQKTFNYKPTGLEAGKTYYWRIDAKNDMGVTKGNVWKFIVINSADGINTNQWYRYEPLRCNPNPVSSSTTLTFITSKNCRVKLDLYNALGELIKVVTDENYDIGIHDLTVQRNNLPAGTYFIKMKSEGKVLVERMVLE